MINQSAPLDDEISLQDILRFVGRNRLLLLLTPLLFTLSALTYTWAFVTPSYQAFATIQVGQVNGKPLESGFVLEQRLKDRSFISDIITQHRALFSQRSDLANEQANLERTLTVKKNKETDLVEVSLLAYSRELATKKAEALLDTLRRAHTPLYQASLDATHKQIDAITLQLDALKHSSLTLREAKQTTALTPYNAVVDALVENDHEAQMRALGDRKLGLEMGLNEAMTFNTKLLGSVYVPYNPVSPNHLLIAVAAFMLGLFVGLIAGFMRDLARTAD